MTKREREYIAFLLERGQKRATFTPAENCPPIILTCGKFDANGKFHPKNIKLTSISRLNKFERRYLNGEEWNSYIDAMKRKDPTWKREAAEERWAKASKAYFDYVREVRIETRLNHSRKRITQQVLQLALS